MLVFLVLNFSILNTCNLHVCNSTKLNGITLTLDKGISQFSNSDVTVMC